MIDPIKLALNQQFLINFAAIVFIVIFAEITAATIADQTQLFSEQNEGTHRFYVCRSSYFQLFAARLWNKNPKLVWMNFNVEMLWMIDKNVCQ